MNSYTIKSIDEKKIVVTFTINGKSSDSIMDVRYLPSEDPIELDKELNRQLEIMSKDETKVIPEEVKQMIGVKKELIAKEVSSEEILLDEKIIG
ncbi:MAG: hypothetical protein WC842_04315 [Candidatus Paceibacterota bacterium]|jgi:hypothetical protein